MPSGFSASGIARKPRTLSSESVMTRSRPRQKWVMYVIYVEALARWGRAARGNIGAEIPKCPVTNFCPKILAERKRDKCRDSSEVICTNILIYLKVYIIHHSAMLR